MPSISFDPVVICMLSGIYIILCVASCITWILGKKYPEKSFTELKQRVRSWWVMVMVFSFAMLLTRTVSIVFLGFVSFLTLKEYFSIIPVRRADRRVLFWAYLAIPIQFYFVSIGWYGMFLVFIPVYLFLFIPFRMVLIGDTKNFLQAAGTTHWGVMAFVFSLSHVSYLLMLPPASGASVGGAGMMLFLVFLTQANDVAQYIWGKQFGKHKIIPKVSPNKTWEGFGGGVLTTTVLALGLSPWLTPMALPMAAAAGVLISCAGFIGDVTISALKRDLGIKDSGTMLPGHGGVLDRVDSLIYTAPLFFHFVYYFYY